MKMHQKYNNLQNILKSHGSLAVAFSGGVDSTFLLKTAHDILGNKTIAVTAQSCFFPEWEQTESKKFCEKEKIRQLFCNADVLNIKEITQNPPNRCYICKNEILSKIKQTVEQYGIYDIKHIADGSNFDDGNDYRPGFQAVQEHGIKSPLREAQLTKYEIRELSKELNLPTWNKSPFACLASRFPYGDEITEKKLGMVEQAEQLLLNLGFAQFRVRIHGKNSKNSNNGKNGENSKNGEDGEIARIEVNPNDFKKIIEPEISQKIHAEFRKYGFTYITLDLGGYRMGSMNEVLNL